MGTAAADQAAATAPARGLRDGDHGGRSSCGCCQWGWGSHPLQERNQGTTHHKTTLSDATGTHAAQGSPRTDTADLHASAGEGTQGGLGAGAGGLALVAAGAAQLDVQGGDAELLYKRKGRSHVLAAHNTQAGAAQHTRKCTKTPGVPCSAQTHPGQQAWQRSGKPRRGQPSPSCRLHASQSMVSEGVAKPHTVGDSARTGDANVGFAAGHIGHVLLRAERMNNQVTFVPTEQHTGRSGNKRAGSSQHSNHNETSTAAIDQAHARRGCASEKRTTNVSLNEA